MFQNVDFYTYSEIIEMGEMVIVNNYTIFSRNYYLVIGVYQDYTYIVPCIYLIFLKKRAQLCHSFAEFFICKKLYCIIIAIT